MTRVANDRPTMDLRQPRYRLIAPIYDLLGALYTGRGIEATRRIIARSIQPGQRVLSLGGGTGREAEHALRRGAEVTLVDRSPSMLARAERRLARGSEKLADVRIANGDCPRRPWIRRGKRLGGCPSPSPVRRLVRDDALRFLATERSEFDHIWLSFFLNVFDRDELSQLWPALAARLAPGGRIWIADFAPARSGIAGVLQRVYYALPLSVFALLTGNAWHGLVDYAALAREHGLVTASRHSVPIGKCGPKCGPKWLRVWALRRHSSP